LKLSIVIPALNEAGAIEAALRVLQVLRESGVEVIVSDGGSTDATAALARPLVDRVIDAPRGRARQMNAGAAIAAGDVLLFLHADTTLPESALRAILGAMTAVEPLPPTVWGRFDVAIVGRARMLRVIATMMNLRSRLTGIATGDQCLFMTRAAFNLVGGFPDQPLMEDIEMSKRLKRHGAPVCLRERVITSGRRWESRGVWRTIFLMWRLRLAYFLGTPADALARRY
jgi:rSAM/selenodomain-associated transferase 2